MNVVALIGNLAADPELRYTPSGKAVCTFRLAVSRPGNEPADFFTIVAWERQAEVCGQYLVKGRRVGIEGRLHHSTWEAEDKSRRSRVEVIAHRVQLIGAPRPTPEPAAIEDPTAGDAAEVADLARDGQLAPEVAPELAPA
jgi:single-strand DNA-binding protein